jgi:tetratricopeptide (TPR) repeat protein
VRIHLHDYAGAIADYTHLLEQEKNAENYLHRGWALYFAEAWKQALGDFEVAIKSDAGKAEAYIGRGLSRTMLGNYRAGVADAEKALRGSVEEANMMHNIACIFALSLAKAQSAKDLPDRAHLIMEYSKRSLQALRRALTMVPPGERAAFWRDKVLPDTALDAVRDSPGFRQLAREYTKSDKR